MRRDPRDERQADVVQQRILLAVGGFLTARVKHHACGLDLPGQGQHREPDFGGQCLLNQRGQFSCMLQREREFAGGEHIDARRKERPVRLGADLAQLLQEDLKARRLCKDRDAGHQAHGQAHAQDRKQREQGAAP